MKKISKKTLLPIVTVVGLFGGIYLIGTLVPETVIREFIDKAGPYGVIVFILLTWLTYILAPLGGTPFLYAGFYLYGQKVVIFTFMAAIMASISNYWVAKKWGRKLVIRLVGENDFNKVDEITRRYGLTSLFIFRICMGQFHDILSYLYGLTNIKFWPYLLVSTAGMIPSSILMYYLSAKMKNPLIFLIINVSIAYVFFSIYILIKKLASKRLVVDKNNKVSDY